MAYGLTISAVLAIILGFIILIWPKALNIGVALYLIISGILGLFNF